ncbi:MAG TPA: Ig-like domain-containing protein, partial [Pirellulales bacterium]|nr:Ig-like domain-containing protein [Pirellulales bacterium]
MPRSLRSARSLAASRYYRARGRQLRFEGLERRWLLNGSAEANVLLQPTPATAVYGQDVNLAATITAAVAGGSNPTGTVTFEVGSTSLGTAGINAATGIASLATTQLPVGSDTVTAVYSG